MNYFTISTNLLTLYHEKVLAPRAPGAPKNRGTA